MELLESQDPEKKRLIETSERHKRALEKEVSEITEKTDKMLTNALIIGGSLLATYFVVSAFSGGSKKKKRRRKKEKYPFASFILPFGSSFFNGAVAAFFANKKQKLINK